MSDATHLKEDAPKHVKVIEIRGKIAPLLGTAISFIYIGNEIYESKFSKEQIELILEGLKLLQDMEKQAQQESE